MQFLNKYKNRIISVIIVLLFLLLIIFVANKRTTPAEEELVKSSDKVVETQAPVKTSEEIEQEKQNENLKIITDKLEIINKKHEILKTYIPSDYTELDALNTEILNLNNTIKEKQIEIAAEHDIFQNISDNLDSVNTSLNDLIIIFGDAKENTNMISGIITVLNKESLHLMVNDKEYLITYDTSTLIDGNLEVNVPAIVICNGAIIDGNNIANFIILNKVE